ncbi:RHS repeat-associated core domain-containing protein [Diaphorobacter aerolatus]|uniref:RHS repeat protein n=1 Tax=Diaphorobacter aerolatus TaxID=1288495 RepID=A0A7H0GM45_9BURK|nr:RHS repeat-associated core domain-containing protein [Diaphorobacter aerolatus]QNP49361.1 RHS repeat protein [Diaphorobacter aerolatus]
MQFERDVQGQPRVYHYGGYTQRFDYDDAGRMVRLTNENGAHTTFEYDAMDRLTKQVNFDGRTQHYQFNAVGDLLRSDDEGLISRYHYDKGGRLLKRQMGESNQAPAEHFSYTQDGQLAKAWHVTELGGNTITAGFERDMLGRIIRETQSITGPDGSEVWTHEVRRQFDELGSESQTTYTGLPAIGWQTYGPGHLHGMVLDGRSVIDFERDKLHRETQRRFGPTQTTRSYDALSRLSHLHTHSPLIAEDESPSTLQRQHHYDAAGQLTRIETLRGPHEYGYDKAGRLIAASQPGLAMQHYRFDPAGNRLFENARIATGPEHWEETVRQHMGDKRFNPLGENAAKDHHNTAAKWMDNRITDDGEFHYEYDAWGNLRRKHKAEGNEQHHYHYDSNHRLIRFEMECDTAVRGANYHYDPFGRRVVKQVQQGDAEGNLQGPVQTTFFGWDGDRLVLTEKDNRQIHTIYEPGSFVPMIRVEGDKQPPKRTLAQKLQEQQGIRLDRNTESLFDGLEQELRRGRLSAFSQQWMQMAQMQPAVLRAMLDPEPSMQGRLVHAYQCDHLGTPMALVGADGAVEPGSELDAWGSALEKPVSEKVHQPIKLQGQQIDEESGLHYNRYRYYDTRVGRYITEDPIGLAGGWNTSAYALANPNNWVDPLGLEVYLCKQPAFGIKNGPVDHHWIKTDSEEAGMGGIKGNVPGNDSGDMPGDPVQVTSHAGRSKESGATCTKIEGVDENKVNRALKIGRPLGHWGPTNQCQSFARQTLLEAGWKPSTGLPYPKPAPGAIPNPLPPFGM